MRETPATQTGADAAAAQMIAPAAGAGASPADDTPGQPAPEAAAGPDADGESEPLVLTPADLAGCGYQAVLAAEPDGLHYGWSNTLLELSQAALAAGRRRHAKALGILAAITSMQLSPDTLATPFLPGMRWQDGARSPLPEDLAPETYDWLAMVAPGVADNGLRARMADLIWLRAKRHGVRFAELAIDAYMASSLDPDHWCESLGMDWKRALQLAKFLGKAGAARVDLIAARLLAALRACAAELAQGAAPLWYATILYEGQCPGVDASALGDEMAALARRHAEGGNFWLARDFFETASRWYERDKKPDQCLAMLVEVARQWEAQGDANGAAAASLHFYQKAVQAWRDVPAAVRERLAGPEALEGARRKVLDAGQDALGQMQAVKGPRIEVDDFIAYAQQRVQCLRPVDALLGFCDLAGPPSFALHREGAIEQLSGTISRLFGSTTIAGDGRAVEMHAGGAVDAPGEAELMSVMVRDFDRQVQLTALAMIGPALHTMRQNFGMSQSDFAFLAEHSPLVPRDRVDLFAKGLHAGFCLDFIQATHLLQPQFEHLVRMQLKAAGALTTTHVDGIDMEVGLSSLVIRPQMVAVFGEDVTFEILAVMCHQQGANLRNAVAHGQADTALCESPQAVYAWWLILRQVLESLRAMSGAGTAPRAQSAPEPAGPPAPAAPQER